MWRGRWHRCRLYIGERAVIDLTACFQTSPWASKAGMTASCPLLRAAECTTQHHFGGVPACVCMGTRIQRSSPCPPWPGARRHLRAKARAHLHWRLPPAASLPPTCDCARCLAAHRCCRCMATRPRTRSRWEYWCRSASPSPRPRSMAAVPSDGAGQRLREWPETLNRPLPPPRPATGSLRHAQSPPPGTQQASHLFARR